MARNTVTPAEIASTQLVVGIEIHVELATRSKMFSPSGNPAHPNYYQARPNTLVDPVVMALPGALPVLNRDAIEMAMMVGLALNCHIPEYCKWDRKSYFYPDLPKGYQISQYDLPLCVDGSLTISIIDAEDEHHEKSVGIIRAHLEEDTGKLGHELPGGIPYDGSLVDLNRAGVPLLEIVSAPDMASAEEAVAYGREIHNICRFLGVSECIMQQGQMRFEPNVNVIIRTDDDRLFTTPIVEVKNLNSFRSLREAIEYEHQRQVDAWLEDGVTHAPGQKTTRGWDDQKHRTFRQREKEEAQDYRYFPDPDLQPVCVSRQWRDEVAERLPELPRQRRARYVEDYALHPADAAALTADRALCHFYETCVDEALQRNTSDAPADLLARECAKLLLNAGARRANEHATSIDQLGIRPAQVGQLVVLRESNHVGSSAMDELFGMLCEDEADARTLAEQHNLLQVSDDEAIRRWIEQAVQEQPDAAGDYAAGKDAAIGRLIGAAMKASRGQADATLLREHFQEYLR